MMKCIFSGERLRVNETVSSSESLATRDYSASLYSRPSEPETRVDSSNIEEAESSLRESSFLNYEEARALLGRLEFQKGNIEAALHVFEGIDILAVATKIQVTISRRCDPDRRRSQSDALSPLMSMHAVSLLCEAIFLKAKSLQCLQRFIEATQPCKLILDTIEMSSKEGLPEFFSIDSKFREILNKAVELLPELWKISGASQETIASYRRALFYRWNLDVETKSRIEKEFAVFLLYSGCEANPPNLRFQMEGSFVPRNNIEEAVLLLLILLRKISLHKIGWDPSILDHLSFALSISGELKALAHQIEEFLPGIMERKERFSTLALCYYGEGEDLIALNLLRNMFQNRDDPSCIKDLLIASKICRKHIDCAEEGIAYAHNVLSESPGICNSWMSVANFILGTLLSNQSRSLASDSDRSLRKSESLDTLKTAERYMVERDPDIIYEIGLESAEQRKLDVALYYAKQLLIIEGGASIRSYIFLARILSAQKRFVEAEGIINAGLDQTESWDQGELLQTKAKLQIGQGMFKNAIETYTQLLAVLQLNKKNFRVWKKLLKDKGNNDIKLEVDTWHDLANIYTSLSQWRDAEICLSKSKAVTHSASWWHSTGLLYEAKGLHKEALKSFEQSLEVDPTHVPSLISIAMLLKQLSDESFPVVRSFLSQALRMDRTNPRVWYNLGLLYKAEKGPMAAFEAADCFEAAALLEDCEPVEPFR